MSKYTYTNSNKVSVFLQLIVFYSMAIASSEFMSVTGVDALSLKRTNNYKAAQQQKDSVTPGNLVLFWGCIAVFVFVVAGLATNWYGWNDDTSVDDTSVTTPIKNELTWRVDDKDGMGVGMDVYYGDMDGDGLKDGMHIRDFDNDGILDAFQQNGNQQFSIETRDGVDYYVLDLDGGNNVRFIDQGIQEEYSTFGAGQGKYVDLRGTVDYNYNTGLYDPEVFYNYTNSNEADGMFNYQSMRSLRGAYNPVSADEYL